VVVVVVSGIGVSIVTSNRRRVELTPTPVAMAVRVVRRYGRLSTITVVVCGCGAGHPSLMRRPDTIMLIIVEAIMVIVVDAIMVIIVVMLLGDKASTGTNGTDFSVTSGVVVLVPTLPEWSFTGTRGVVVGWRGAVTLLLAVVSGESNLKQGRDEKEDPGAYISIVLHDIEREKMHTC